MINLKAKDVNVRDVGLKGDTDKLKFYKHPDKIHKDLSSNDIDLSPNVKHKIPRKRLV